MPTILVTGYGPFRDYIVNPSWEAVKKLPLEINGWTVVKHLMPVEYEFVSYQVPAWISELKPEIIIHVGVGQTGQFKIEQCGHNGTYSMIDTKGDLPLNGKCHQSLDPGVILHSKLPLTDYCRKFKLKGWKAELSTDAGRFLCDFALTMSLLTNPKSVFFHVPPINSPYSQDQIDLAVLNFVGIATEMS